MIYQLILILFLNFFILDIIVQVRFNFLLTFLITLLFFNYSVLYCQIDFFNFLIIDLFLISFISVFNEPIFND